MKRADFYFVSIITVASFFASVYFWPCLTFDEAAERGINFVAFAFTISMIFEMYFRDDE